jgi:hypothetical protein
MNLRVSSDSDQFGIRHVRRVSRRPKIAHVDKESLWVYGELTLAKWFRREEAMLRSVADHGSPKRIAI